MPLITGLKVAAVSIKQMSHGQNMIFHEIFIPLLSLISTVWKLNSFQPNYCPVQNVYYIINI